MRVSYGVSFVSSTSDKFCPSLCSVVYIKNNAWVTMNNNFWVMSEAICQKFSRVD